jgi:nicotinamidase-related amidase
MPTLQELLTPSETVVLTVEMQRGVIGDQVTSFGGGALLEAVQKAGSIPAAQRLVRAARAAGARVVHATISLRADRAGLSRNNRMIAAILRQTGQMLEGTPATELIPELELAPSDIIVNRVHGLTPFGGTELDAVLRNLGTKTLVPIGVSVNVAIMGTCLSASDLGYQIVLPTDAVVGVPESYAADALANTLSYLATLTSVDDIIKVWS